MHRGRFDTPLLALLISGLLVSGVALAVVTLDVTRYSFPGGGSVAGGAGFAVAGSIGQPAVGWSRGGGYSVSGGFLWQLATPAPTPTATPLPGGAHDLYLPLVLRDFSPLPDLVGSFSLSPNASSFSPGEAVTITVVITNQGAAPAGPFWADFYINPSTPPVTAGKTWDQLCGLSPCYGLTWYVGGGLAPGQRIVVSSLAGSYNSSYSNWPGYFAPGTTELYLYVDSYNTDGSPSGAVLESNESNNRFELHGLSVQGASSSIVEPTWIPVGPRQP